MRVPKPMLTEFGIHRRFESRENHLTKWVLLDIFFISQPQRVSLQSCMDEPIFMAGTKPLPNEFGYHHGMESGVLI